MRTSLIGPLVALALLCGSPVAAQQAGKKTFESPAELVPADTIFYKEVTGLKELAQEVRGLFKGSALGNLPDSLRKVMAKYKLPASEFEHEGTGVLMVIGELLSPEMARECGRIDGAAVAVTGIGKGGQPDYVVVILPGSSNLPGMAVRALQMSPHTTPAGEVEGVPVYQQWTLSYDKAATRHEPGHLGAPVAVVSRPGLASARLPGVLLLGSMDGVKQAIRRARGKVEDQPLAQSELFQEVKKKVGGGPGLLAYANLPEVARLLGGHLKEAQEHGGPGAAFVQSLVEAVNPKAFRGWGASLTLSKGELNYTEVTLLDPTQKSPVLDLLPREPFDTKLLQYVPQDAVFAAGMSNAGGGKRWQSLLDLLDKMAPGDRRPSEEIRQRGKKLGIDWEQDLAAPVTHVAFAVGNFFETPRVQVTEKGPGFTSTMTRTEVPMVLVLGTEDAAAAEQVAKQIPKLFNAATHKEVKPARATALGQKLMRLEYDETYSLFYAVSGSVLVVGPSEREVAQAVRAGKEAGLIGRAGLASRLEKLDGPSMVVAMKPFSTLASTLIPVAQGVATTEARVEVGPGGAQVPKEEGPPPGGGETKRTVKRLDPEPELVALGKMLADEPLMVFGVNVTRDAVVERGAMAGLDRFVPQVTNFILDRYYQSRAERGERRPLQQRGEEQEQSQGGKTESKEKQ